MTREPLAARAPCPACSAEIAAGARKCPACKRWVGPPRSSREPGPPSRPVEAPRASLAVGVVALSTAALLVWSRGSEVAEAPPLTDLPGASASASPSGRVPPSPAAIGPDSPLPRASGSAEPPGPWTSKQFWASEGRPLDLAFSPSGTSLYVSRDDGSLSEHRVPSGELLHRGTMPVVGDRLELLGGRYLATIREVDAARIALLDTQRWERDPALLEVGRGPGDVLPLPDGTLVTSSTSGRKLTRFEPSTGARLGDITLPHSAGQLLLVRVEGRPHVAVVGGVLPSSSAQTSAAPESWVELFDPNERPFGATRRSIAAGREPRVGAASADGTRLALPDRASNVVRLIDLEAGGDSRAVPVGLRPEAAAFVGPSDRWVVVADAGASTATVVDSQGTALPTTHPLGGVPRTLLLSPDRTAVFVLLGGPDWPPRGRGLVVMSGDPPRVTQTLPTGEGPCAIAISPDGRRVAVASYWERSVTVLER